MTPSELRERTVQFAVRILRLADSLPRTASGRAVAQQISRSGCSVGANYRAALRGKSRADFVSKITTVLEEADETAFWLELTERTRLLAPHRLRLLRVEAEELTKIFAATRSTARKS